MDITYITYNTFILYNQCFYFYVRLRYKKNGISPPVGSTVEMFHWDRCLNNFFWLPNLLGNNGTKTHKNHICYTKVAYWLCLVQLEKLHSRKLTVHCSKTMVGTWHFLVGWSICRGEAISFREGKHRPDTAEPDSSCVWLFISSSFFRLACGEWHGVVQPYRKNTTSWSSYQGAQ